jgi:hypothetical protein
MVGPAPKRRPLRLAISSAEPARRTSRRGSAQITSGGGVARPVYPAAVIPVIGAFRC